MREKIIEEEKKIREVGGEEEGRYFGISTRSTVTRLSHIISDVILDEDYQRYLVKHPSPIIRAAAAANSSLLGKYMLEFVHDSDETVRSALANNPYMPRECIDVLIRDTSSAVRASLADRSDLSVNHMLTLASDADVYVRYTLARNWHITKSVIDILFDQNKDIIYYSMAGNPCLREKHIMRLVHHPDEMIVEKLARNISILSKAQFILAGRSIKIRASLAKNVNICSEVQELLARDNSVYVRMNLAINEGLCDSAFLILYRDKADHVVDRLMSNINYDYFCTKLGLKRRKRTR